MLDPKDVRLKLDPDMHAALVACADVDGLGIAELAQQVLGDYVRRRVHEATVLAERASRLGITGAAGGTSGKGRE